MVSAANTIGSDKVLQDHWIRRFVAFIIDSVIFWIVAWILFWALPLGFAWWAWSFGIPLIYGLLFCLYAVVMEMHSGATIGKQVMGLQVVAFAGPVDFEKALVRNISKIYGLILFLDWLIGFVTEGDPKQKFLDRQVGTTVEMSGYPSVGQQHIYQTPPGREPQYTQEYQHQNAPVYQYQQPGRQHPQQEQAAPGDNANKCDCGGSLILTGDGRHQCIRCGKIS